MSLRPETRDAVEAYLSEHGGTYRHALAMVMATRAAEEWNSKCPIGTPCMLETHRGATKIPTRTRSLAWATSSGSASVMIEGKTGSYGLEWLTPCASAAGPS